MPSEVILPRVDMDMATGKIAKWFVDPGATVIKGQPLFEIETDKAAMEIEAPASGTIRDLVATSGADIPVGAVVAWIFAEGEAQTVAPAAPSPAAIEPARAAAEDAVFDSSLPNASTEAPGAETTGVAGTGAAGQDPNRPRATPMARRLARASGLDLAALTGTGPRGRIQADDVSAALQRSPEAISSTPAGPMGAAASSDVAPPQASATKSPALPKPAGALNLVQLREGEGRPTLLIHGFGSDANTWRPFLVGRTAKNPVIAIELPGHGASPLGSIADFTDLVDAVEATLTGAGLGMIDLVGHSLGGGVAAALAGRGALDLHALLLLAPAGLGPAINGAFLAGFLGARSEASLTPWMHQLVSDPSVITPAFVRATLKAREGSDLAENQLRVAEAVFPDATQSFSIRDDLERVGVPTRVVIGGADRILPSSTGAGLPGHVALHQFAGCGHMPQLERRETVLRIAADMIG